MNNELIEKIKKSFNNDTNFERFPDFITDIHFPCFKGLAPNSEIRFQFPLTVLVGENGCGKSSVLQALETAPEGSSYSQKWFSTRVDPIPEEPRPAFWYFYNSSEAKKNVQVLNLRIKKESNPDYWEPSRPVAKYGMELFPKEMAKTPGASGTRWNGTKRNILYLDFRGELTAFDKYFYFGEKPNTITLKTKQDYIRYYSVYLKGVIDGWVKAGFKYRRIKRVEKISKLVSDEIETISFILDKQYEEISIVTHSFYKQWGDSVYFKLKNIHSETFNGNYTEAFAGSGESAVVKLIHQVYQTPKGTLVLLDEPEVSLHPGAQKRLLDFLLKQTLEKGLQIVLTSHSPAIVEELPKEAVVLLHKSLDGTFSPKCSIELTLAFQYIGQTNFEKPKIIVEDKLAELLVNKALAILDTNASKSIDVICHAGGAKDIYKEAVVLSRLSVTKTYLLLDGDQKCDIPSSNAIAEKKLDEIITNITGVAIAKLGFVADSGSEFEQLLSEKKKYLDYLKSNCFFLPLRTPEEILWKCSEKSPHTVINELKKDAYKLAIAETAKEDMCGDVSANDIFCFQKKLCNAIPRNNEKILEIVNTVKNIIE
ncbi:AAA family ATPase [uncultured Treponema sp.]|uniref:ATP-dependent nuclease n=1 Tax=uncultured Treponema sp. TaxID=162155 RepID=UPI00258A9B39|nr:AAA family ATPase [uncultured Treponema sp.]